jgi:hypothetical protein
LCEKKEKHSENVLESVVVIVAVPDDTGTVME